MLEKVLQKALVTGNKPLTSYSIGEENDEDTRDTS